ncbi:MAG: hypothetical protein ACREO3_03080 [Arenimonas sp.]
MADPSKSGGTEQHALLHPGSQQARAAGYQLLKRMLVYHLSIAAILAIAVWVFPSLPRYLPIGGVSQLATTPDLLVTKVKSPRPEDAAHPVAPPPPTEPVPGLDRFGYARRLAIALVGIWLLMLPVSWVHKGIYRNGASDHSLDEATMVLPGVVAAIVMVVQYSLALAFALAGIVAGVQFRRALQDTFDALFILVAIGTGIAAGVGALEVAVVMILFFCYATVYVCCFGDGLETDHSAVRTATNRMAREEAADDD